MIGCGGVNFAKLKNGEIDQRFFGVDKYLRTDYPKISPSFKFNCSVSMDENSNLRVSKLPL